MNVSFNITCNNHNHNHKTKSEGKNLTAYLVKNSSNLKCQKVIEAARFWTHQCPGPAKGWRMFDTAKLLL